MPQVTLMLAPCHSQSPPLNPSARSGCWELATAHGCGRVAPKADSRAPVALGGLALAELADTADAITGVAPQAQGWGWAGTQAQAQRAGRLGSDSHTTGPQLCGSVASGRLPLGPSERTVAPFHTQVLEGRPLTCSQAQLLTGHCHPCPWARSLGCPGTHRAPSTAGGPEGRDGGL